MIKDQQDTHWNAFRWLYASEMLSVTGTGLTAFALGAWVYATTGDTTAFALLSVAAILPGHLLLPVSGVLADLLPRRRVMWACNLMAGTCAVVLIVLLAGQNLSMGFVYILLSISALCRTLQWITFTATMTQMVPSRHLGRMSALIYIGEAGQQILAPMVAALLLPWLSYTGVIGLDAGTFVFALVVLSIIPLPGVLQHIRDLTRDQLRSELVLGWRFIFRRKGLLLLQVFFAISQFLGGFLPILTLPALMELTGSETTTGLTMGAAGLGLIVGTGVLVIRPRNHHRVRATIWCDVASSVSLLVLSLGAPFIGAWWVGLWGFIFLMCHAMESGISQDLWQRKVPVAIQGRVFAIRRFISWSLVPVCYVLAGPLVEDVFAPLYQGIDLPGVSQVSVKLMAIVSLMAVGAMLRLCVLAPSTLVFKSLWTLEDDLPDYA